MVYGRGCFDKVDEIIGPHRKGDAPMVFLLDHFCIQMIGRMVRISLRDTDMLIVADVTLEPKTSYVDDIADELKAQVCGG